MIVKAFGIYCDEESDRCEGLATIAPSRSRRTARASARLAGWKCSSAGDFCPACRGVPSHTVYQLRMYRGRFWVDAWLPTSWPGILRDVRAFTDRQRRGKIRPDTTAHVFERLQDESDWHERRGDNLPG